MKNKAAIISFILILMILATAGCLDFSDDDGITIYQSHPTKISYTISYGYRINCTGSGEYTIEYDCDTPEVLNGDTIPINVQGDKYIEKTLATYNTVKSWNISGSSSNNYNLGITANVEFESYIVADLNGAKALTIQQINDQYPTLVAQYCQAQSNETTVFIDPNDPNIIAIASVILNNASTNNAFLVAKELFTWLKQQTTYQIHIENNNAQSAEFTLQCKTGDCDDLSFLYISLCRSIGIPSRFIRGFLVAEKNAIPHAWAEVFVGGNIGKSGWIPVECAGIADKAETEVHQNFGVESAEHLRLFKDDGSNESLIVSMSDFSSKYSHSMIIETQSYAEVTTYNALRSNELVIDENGNRYYS
jgi:hypothetical protein